MTIANRWISMLMLAALLAPAVRWASSGIDFDDCACPPAACMCPGHQHSSGHAGKCSMANGGQCGLHSSDYGLSSLLSSLTYIPSEHRFTVFLEPWVFRRHISDPSQQPSHSQPPEQPPRLAL
jgi:hypothetical protein